jgi:peptide chain release factor
MTWVLLTAGRGPGECQIAVAGLARVLCTEARAAGVEASLLDAEDGPHGLLSALVALRGDGADALAQSWEGSVRWTCPSPIRKAGRKNWFVGVSRLSPPPPAAAFRESDLRFEALRATGPGGQHVNKTESAVRLTHIPTGIAVLAREERSQHRNRALATARLAAALADRGRSAEADACRDRWSRHAALERGNEVRVYSGRDFARVR